MNKSLEFNTLIGQTFKSIEVIKDDCEDDVEIVFKTVEDKSFSLLHIQDCCEDVYIESIAGDLDDLLNEPILFAEEATGDIEDAPRSGTWTFYKLATIKGYVDIRWCGYSNGYYSESATLIER